MKTYGYSIEHILMVDIIPDPAVRKAMNEINAGKCFIHGAIYHILRIFLKVIYPNFAILVYRQLTLNQL